MINLPNEDCSKCIWADQCASDKVCEHYDPYTLSGSLPEEKRDPEKYREEFVEYVHEFFN